MIADSEEAVVVDADLRGTWAAHLVVTKHLLLDAGVADMHQNARVG